MAPQSSQGTDRPASRGDRPSGARLDRLLRGLHRPGLVPLARHIDEHLVRWAMQKFKQLRGKAAKAQAGWTRFDSTSPGSSPTGTFSRPPEAGLGSRMTGDCHVRFCESRGVRFPPATHQARRRRQVAGQTPRFHLHFTPTSSSWLNLVERWFRERPTKRAARRLPLRARPRRSIQEYIDAHNDDPKPYVWTATAESILAKVARGRIASKSQ